MQQVIPDSDGTFDLDALQSKIGETFVVYGKEREKLIKVSSLTTSLIPKS